MSEGRIIVSSFRKKKETFRESRGREREEKKSLILPRKDGFKSGSKKGFFFKTEREREINETRIRIEDSLVLKLPLLGLLLTS